ncbi:hypothetical protein ACFLRG_03050 [Bacteroidota bacterium]
MKENLKKMAKINRGLCTTCNNAPTCLFYQGNGSRIVWYCETFDNYVHIHKSIPKIEERIKSKTDDAAKVAFKGLCMDCIHNTACIFIKPGGGSLAL